VHTELHDAEAHKCVMHASSTANTGIGDYANEYALFLEFTDDGKKVVNIEEFVDSAYSTSFFAELPVPTPEV
jgi:ketosteroid isomerase-like protein